MDHLLSLLAALPGGDALGAWATGLKAMSAGQRIIEVGKIFFQIVGAIEFIKFVYRLVVRRRHWMEQKIETLEHDVKDKTGALTSLSAQHKQLTADLKEARDKLPEAAIARAERELRDHNQNLAIGHLEDWFAGNAASIAGIAKRLAEYHIAHAVPDPADHLTRAQDLLRIARGAAPDDEDIQTISREFNAVNAALQEQLLHDGENQIPWNSAMARAAGQGEALLPLVHTFRDVARWFFDKGQWRLVPLFAERAADLARQGGQPLRRHWCAMEAQAAFYQSAMGENAKALQRIDNVLARGGAFLPSRDRVTLEARYVRAQTLSGLDRSSDALAEIDAFAPVLSEVLGERHPDTLGTRFLRARTLSELGRSSDALAEIDAFAPVQAEVLGERHPDTLATHSLRIGIEIAEQRTIDHADALRAIIDGLGTATGIQSLQTLHARYRLARLLSQQGRVEEARTEIAGVLAGFDPATDPRHPLLRSAKALSGMMDGAPAAETLIV